MVGRPSGRLKFPSSPSKLHQGQPSVLRANSPRQDAAAHRPRAAIADTQMSTNNDSSRRPTSLRNRLRADAGRRDASCHDAGRQQMSISPEIREALARAERAFESGSLERLEGPPPEVLREMLEAERA